MDPIYQPNLFGELLVKHNYITPEDFQRCLEIQSRMEDPKPIGEILVEQGYLTKRALEHILELQRKKILEREQAVLGMTREEIRHRLGEGNIVDFLSVAAQIKASDLYLLSGHAPVVRVHGNLIDLPWEPLPESRVTELIYQILTERELKALQEQYFDFQFCFTLEGVGRFRASLFRHYHGFDAVFRIIPSRIPTLEELGFPKVVERFLHYTRGLVLITGPASSGKTTTLAAIIEELNQRRKGHIITIEQPIEFIFESKGCLINQREVGRHTSSFSKAFRASLREDPDVIVVGELRDPETFSTALSASETGHLVLGTLHTTNAQRTIYRILDNFPPRMASQVRGMLSSALRGIICQQLIPAKDGTRQYLAVEVMFNNPAIANLIREDKPHQIPMVIQTHRRQGMILMDDSIYQLYEKGLITYEEAYARMEDKSRLGKRNPKQDLFWR